MQRVKAVLENSTFVKVFLIYLSNPIFSVCPLMKNIPIKTRVFDKKIIIIIVLWFFLCHVYVSLMSLSEERCEIEWTYIYIYIYMPWPFKYNILKWKKTHIHIYCINIYIYIESRPLSVQGASVSMCYLCNTSRMYMVSLADFKEISR